MSAQTMLRKQEDALAFLREVMNKNKNDIIAAHEEARKQMTLTDAQQHEFENAKAFMTNADKLADELKQKTENFLSMKENHLASISKINAEIQTQRDELIALKTEVDAKLLHHTEMEKLHTFEWKKIEKERLKMAEEHKIALDATQSAERKASKAKSDYESEMQKSIIERMNRSKKAADLAAQIEEFR